LLQVPVEALEGRLLDLSRQVAQALALGKVGERLAAEADELGRRDRQRLLQVHVLHGAARALAERNGEVGLAHGDRRSPSSSSARWTARTLEPRRLSPPPSCMRQPASQATTQAAPVDSTFLSFLSRICEGTSGSRTENEPPKPQHSSGAGSSCFSMNAHEPEGTTTCSAFLKSSTIRAPTRAAPAW